MYLYLCISACIHVWALVFDLIPTSNNFTENTLHKINHPFASLRVYGIFLLYWETVCNGVFILNCFSIIKVVIRFDDFSQILLYFNSLIDDDNYDFGNYDGTILLQ